MISAAEAARETSERMGANGRASLAVALGEMKNMTRGRGCGNPSFPLSLAQSLSPLSRATSEITLNHATDWTRAKKSKNILRA